MKTSDENKSAQPTPEQLLKLLDSEMNALRLRRTKLESNRRGIQVVGIVLIVVGAAFAFWFLMFMLDDIRPERHRGGPNPARQDASAEVR